MSACARRLFKCAERISRSAFKSTRPESAYSAMIAQASGSVLPMRGTLRGGRHAKVSPTRITHVQKLLPSIHPREPPEAPALLQSVAFKTSHVCTGDTLLEERNRRNRKSMSGCEQTVEDRISLWKPQENAAFCFEGKQCFDPTAPEDAAEKTIDSYQGMPSGIP